MILDGYGLNDKCEHNAVCEAKTPIMDQLMSQCPYVKGQASGLAVAIGLLAVATWLGKVGKNNKMFLFPMVFMLIVTITSLVQTLIANFKGLGAGVGIGWCVARIVLAGLLVILALILAVDGFKTLANQKKAK